jgi:4-methyl-5(b-hydroxyethyl)-thiazole monophosphate biosynthesis
MIEKSKRMKTIFVFLITGFEEIEAVATIDVLRRAGLNVKTVSLTGEKTVVGSHKIPVITDLLFEEVLFQTAELLVIPGGTTAYTAHEGLKKEVRAFHDRGEKVAAICAAPVVFGQLGILKGKKATCYPSYEEYLEGAILHTDQPVVVDGNVITGRGPGLTLDFALALVEVLLGREKRDEVAGQLLVQ